MIFVNRKITLSEARQIPSYVQNFNESIASIFLLLNFMVVAGGQYGKNIISQFSSGRITINDLITV